MRKRILCMILTAIMLLTLIPITAFAGDGYAITNGAPESEEETNHGYITVDEISEEGETVTITVVPNEGYQLKKLTVLSAISMAPPITPAQDASDKTKYTFKMPKYPVRVTAEFEEKAITIADILPANFPDNENDNSWCNSENDNVYIYKTDSDLVFNDNIEDCYSVPLSSPLTKEENPEVSYVYSEEEETKIQFNMTGDNDDELDSIIVRNCTNPSCIGAYAAPATKTIADILATNTDFPTSDSSDTAPDDAWVNENGATAHLANNYLHLLYQNEGLSTNCTASVTFEDGNYVYRFDVITMKFNMENDVLKSITVSNVADELNGTYIAPHVHAFTYTANAGKLTATCTDGCDKDYNTKPLTLTLTAPESLVYDGNAKAFTFANGESDAWTGAGLALPEITYTAKSGCSLTDYKAVNAGSYTASVTVGTDKTASLDFEITKATPYIKTTPAPNEIEYGQKLEESTLVGGSVQVSCTDSTQIGGLFEWTNPDTVPGIDDSEITEYDVTFTPADTNNYNTVSCKITIKVTHTTHNPTLVNGQDPTENENGWKDYYECICGKYYEDSAGNTEIPNLDAWKAEGGNGYIPKLVHGTDTNNNHICDYCEEVISDHNGILQKGTAATLQSAGFKDYYNCDICGKYFEDEACTVEITDLDAWKAKGGNGYIPKLEPTPEPEPINYKITEGAHALWLPKYEKGFLSFRSNADYSKFVSVEVDNKILDASKFIASPGSTIVKLKPEYLSTLAIGKHTLRIVSTDGYAETDFYIEDETIAPTDGGFLSEATMSTAFVGMGVVGLSAVFYVGKKKKLRK